MIMDLVNEPATQAQVTMSTAKITATTQSVDFVGNVYRNIYDIG